MCKLSISPRQKQKTNKKHKHWSQKKCKTYIVKRTKTYKTREKNTELRNPKPWKNGNSILMRLRAIIYQQDIDQNCRLTYQEHAHRPHKRCIRPLAMHIDIQTLLMLVLDVRFRTPTLRNNYVDECAGVCVGAIQFVHRQQPRKSNHSWFRTTPNNTHTYKIIIITDSTGNVWRTTTTDTTTISISILFNIIKLSLFRWVFHSNMCTNSVE